MKYLHIMNYSNYAVAKSFVQFVGEFFDSDEHTFSFVGNYDDRFGNLSDVCEIIHLKRQYSK